MTQQPLKENWTDPIYKSGKFHSGLNDLSGGLGNLKVFLARMGSRLTTHGPRRDKTCLWGFQQSETQTNSPQLQILARKIKFRS